MEIQQERKRSWVEETFFKRDCVRFMPVSQQQHRCYPKCQICQSLIRCCCGRLVGEHQRLDLSASAQTPVRVGKHVGLSVIPSEQPSVRTKGSEQWSVELYTQASPTDAFGTIEFQDCTHSGRAKYVRLSCDAKPEQLLQLMLIEWQMEMPKLVISVHGGMENFDLPMKVKHTFGKGLIKAAESTGAWILTDGMNRGVSRHLGDAAKLYGTRDFRRRHIIGIVPWGIIENHSELIGRDVVRPYQTLGNPLSKRMSLNSQHSHFLLVDDGTVGMHGCQLEIRRKVEGHMRLQRIHGRLEQRMPVLCVIMDGGPDLISLVLDYVKSVPPIPTIVYEGTGRAADLIAFVHKQTSVDRKLDPDIKEDLLLRIQKGFNFGKAQASNIFKLLMECIDFRDSITIIDSESEDQQDLDTSVLTALLKGTKATAPYQLGLTLAWNRADIAKKHILVYGQHWKVGSLEQALLDALVMDRVSFVKLLIENGMNMNRVLTMSRLEQLYNAQEPTNNFLYHLVENVKQSHLPVGYRISLIDVGLVIEYLLGSAYSSTYTHKRFRAVYNNISGKRKENSKESLSQFNRLGKVPRMQPQKEDNARFCPPFCRTAQPYGHKECADLPPGLRTDNKAEQSDNSPFVYSFSDLFAWAVLMRRQEMALFLWQHGEEVMAKAVVACKLYRSMAHEARVMNTGDNTEEELKNYSLEFGQLAVDLLDTAFKQNERMAMKLLTYEMKDFSNFTCLQMAASSGLQSFVSHSCTQMLLTDLWMGRLNMRKNSWFKITLSILLPPAILMLEFKSQAEMSHVPQTYDHPQPCRETGTQGIGDTGHVGMRHYDAEKGSECPTHLTPQEIHWTRKVFEFYNAPVVKFWFHTIAYLVFLMLYSYTVLVKMEPEPTVQEWIVIICIFATAIEKIREVFISEPRKLSKKLEVWCSEYWNISDFTAVILFFIGFGLRWHDPPLRTAGRIAYCLDIIFWYLRLLDLFTVHQHVGPYVTMIIKMTTDMLYIVVMMAVVLVTFGVSRKAILSPNETPSWTLAKDVVFQPYWMMFGEVYAGEIDACAENKPCAPGSFITPFLQAVYLFVQYIIMVNTLIALFNNVYLNMKSISDKIWKYNRYRYILTYQEKPWLPPPFIMLSHISMCICSIYRNRTRRSQQENQCGLKLYLNPEDLKKLHDFEENCVAGYFHKKNELLDCSVTNRIKTTSEKVEEMTGELQEVAEKVHFIRDTLQALDTQLGRLQDLSALAVDTLSVISAKDTRQVKQALIGQRWPVGNICQKLPHSWSHLHLAASMDDFYPKLQKQYRSTPPSLLRCLVRSRRPSLDRKDWNPVVSEFLGEGNSNISHFQSPVTSPQHTCLSFPPLGSKEKTPCKSSQTSQPLVSGEFGEAFYNKLGIHESHLALGHGDSVEENREDEECESSPDFDTSPSSSDASPLQDLESQGPDGDQQCLRHCCSLSASPETMRHTHRLRYSSIPALHGRSKRHSLVGSHSLSSSLSSFSQQRGLSKSSEIYLLKRQRSKMKTRNRKTVKILEGSSNTPVRLSDGCIPHSCMIFDSCRWRKRREGNSLYKNWSASASLTHLNLEPMDLPLKCSFSCQVSLCASPYAQNSLVKSVSRTSLVQNGTWADVKNLSFHTAEDLHPHYSAVERNNLMRLAYTIPFTPVSLLGGEEVSVYTLEEATETKEGINVFSWSQRGFSALLQPLSCEGLHGGLRKAMRVLCTWAEGDILKPGNIYIVKTFRPEVMKTWQSVFHSNTLLQLCLREVQQQQAAQKLMHIFNKIKPCIIPYSLRFLDVSLLHWRSEDKWFTVERYMPGDFQKYNNNNGEEISPSTCLEENILAFSHWTYQFSQGELLVLDLQGVGVELTDPSVIRSEDKTAPGDLVFGPANLGNDAIQSFIQNHACNSCCRKLQLSDLKRSNAIRGEINFAFEEEIDMIVTRL
ncbi:transient receptor potential cation channel subfamily M member 6 isoform X1 [Paramormyrops kingsleyae]|uniref:non-specific serine/threonine protein kinase n=1 Tax=Paramormyrops kingsleyae TaxID=1676925 RepID=A0A3B3R190_9TELE|nr:transient receptor potential cation channel subfamily M member 6-like isoform X1 [Paramormyrops kingsleyae]